MRLSRPVHTPGRGATDRAVPDRGELVPLAAVRCATALVAVLLGTVVWSGSFWVVLPVVVAAGAAVLPSIGLVTLSLLLLAVAYAVNVPAGSPWLLVFVAGLHAVFVLYLLLLRLPLRGWISGAALRELAWSFLRIQAVAQPVALLALLLGGAGSSPGVVAVGVAAFSAWALWLVGQHRA
ncbi:hypothetical protein [Arthrobacter sp. B0490]|uniref:hypothetical protein n=1 Tax=Arthrobacter sp. B0490 TaxID=2058891 RepID=UPI000CE56BD6|nr:hypothetical protein [Arthrobacter sp. B0490]